MLVIRLLSLCVALFVLEAAYGERQFCHFVQKCASNHNNTRMLDHVDKVFRGPKGPRGERVCCMYWYALIDTLTLRRERR